MRSRVRFCVVIGADEKGSSVILSCETGGAYASEVEMLSKLLSKVRHPFGKESMNRCMEREDTEASIVWGDKVESGLWFWFCERR